MHFEVRMFHRSLQQVSCGENILLIEHCTAVTASVVLFTVDIYISILNDDGIYAEDEHIMKPT